MAKNPNALVIGGAGGLFVAPLGTTLPQTVAETLDAAFLELGYTSEDGVSLKREPESKGIRVWPSAEPVRQVISEMTFEISANLAEWNKVVIPFAFGGGTITETPTSSGNFVYTFPGPEVVDERALVFDFADGTRKFRLVVPRGKVSGGVDTTIKLDELSQLGVTFSVMPAANGAKTVLISNDWGTSGGGGA